MKLDAVSGSLYIIRFEMKASLSLNSHPSFLVTMRELPLF